MLAEDVSEPIVRPSIKVGIETSSNGRFNSQCREKYLTCRIYYFASDRYKYKIENAKMQDLIENAFFDDLMVKESFYIPIESVVSEAADTVLICSFDLYSIVLIPDNDSLEPMENLEIKL